MTPLFIALCMLSGSDTHMTVFSDENIEVVQRYVDSEERRDEDCYIQENAVEMSEVE